LKRKLQLLNVVLLGLIVVVGFRIHNVWKNARERETRMLNIHVPLEKAVPLMPLPQFAATSAIKYSDVAQNMLFSRDRNPNVIYDPPAPAPPPPPMPALPTFYGMMKFRTPGIILSEKPGAPQKTYHAGEQVGPFKLVAFDDSHVTLDWDGKKVERNIEELVEKAPTAGAGNAQNTPSAAQAAPAAAVQNVAPLPLGPGVDIGGGFHGCQANDSTPSGTVQNGLRKIETATPFGKSCKWEPVK
jgi:hypothetical protein